MFTYAIVIGMTYDQFWLEDPYLFYMYLDAYEFKTKREAEAEIEKMNFNAWLHGFYIDIALAANHPLAKRKGKYIEKPIDLKGKKVEETMSEEEIEEYEQAKALMEFNNFGRYAKAYNNQYFGGEEGE